MGRTGRADGWRHDQKKPLDGDGFRGQGRAIGHRGDRRAVRRRERQGGSRVAALTGDPTNNLWLGPGGGISTTKQSPYVRLGLLGSQSHGSHRFREVSQKC